MQDSWTHRFRSWVQARPLVRRHWRTLLRLRGRFLLSEETIHLLLAAGVGILGGLVNLAFYLAGGLLKRWFLQGDDDAAELAAQLDWWRRLLTPAAGGLCAGLVLHWADRVAKRRETGNLLEVVVAGDGRLPLRGALSRTLSSLLTISSGGSIGREGPITHLSAALASAGGQWAGWPPYRLRLLVACGAAAGIAAAYNAPIAGAVFAAQIVLGSFSMGHFAPLVCASVVATMVSRTFFGIAPSYEVPTSVEFTRIAQLPWFVVLGLLSGICGAGFMVLLRAVSRAADLTGWPVAVRLLLGGLAVGALAIVFPQVWGNGYGPTNDVLHGHYLLPMLASLVLAKLLATLLTVGSGAVGGVFTPTLFLGAGLGAVLGGVLADYGLAGELPTAAFAIVGMGGMLAATTHSPLLAMIMVFEISSNYTLMPPLMLACAVATLSSRRLCRESVYTEPLRRRGIVVDRDGGAPGSATQPTVGDILRPPVDPLRPTARFREIVDRFLTTPFNYLPVVSADRRLVGLVALEDLKQYLGAGPELDSVIAFDVMRPPPACLTPDQRLADAVPVLLASEQRNVPVVSTLAEMKLVGAVARAEALERLTEAVSAPRAGRG